MAKETMPQLETEKEEAEFWDTHDSTGFFDETEELAIRHIDARQPMKQISLRLDAAIIEQLKAVAYTRGIGYQTLIRMWVMERLTQDGS